MVTRFRASSALAEALTREGRSLAWLAKRSGLCPSHISRIVRGKRSVGIDGAAKIAAALGRTIGVLFDPIGKPSVPATRVHGLCPQCGRDMVLLIDCAGPEPAYRIACEGAADSCGLVIGPLAAPLAVDAVVEGLRLILRARRDAESHEKIAA